MQKHSQTNNICGIGTTPDYGMNMDFIARMDIIFVEVKDRSRQSPTTNEPALVKDKEYEDLVTTELLVTLCEGQESVIEEQEKKIQDLETQLQDYEQEIYEKDQILQLAGEPKPQIKQESKGKWRKPHGHKLGPNDENCSENLDRLITEQSTREHFLDYENGGI